MLGSSLATLGEGWWAAEIAWRGGGGQEVARTASLYNRGRPPGAHHL